MDDAKKFDVLRPNLHEERRELRMLPLDFDHRIFHSLARTS